MAATADRQGEIHIWDAATGRTLHRLTSVGRPVYRDGLRMMGYDVKIFPRWECGELTEEAKAELKDIVTGARIGGQAKALRQPN